MFVPNLVPPSAGKRSVDGRAEERKAGMALRDGIRTPLDRPGMIGVALAVLERLLHARRVPQAIRDVTRNRNGIGRAVRVEPDFPTRVTLRHCAAKEDRAG